MGDGGPDGMPAGPERIWDYYQNEAPAVFAASRARLLYLAREIEKGKKVLNIGVGAGIFEEIALARGLDIFSLDPSEQSIAAIRRRCGTGDKARVGYSRDIPFPAAVFDAVVASEIFEHLDPGDLETSLREISRVLVPGGWLLGTVPAGEDLSVQQVVCPACGSRFHRWGHRQSIDAGRVREILSPVFHVDRIVRRPFVSWRSLNWKGGAAALGKLILWRVGIHGSGESICFRARKSLARNFLMTGSFGILPFIA